MATGSARDDPGEEGADTIVGLATLPADGPSGGLFRNGRRMVSVLVTGPPGSGKTTLVRRVVDLLASVRMAGFYTEEVRGRTGRTGFRVVTLDGRTARLATVGSGQGPKVGRYVVHLGEFEEVAVPQLHLTHDVELLVIDEIGKMECLSPAFVEATRRALAGTVPVLGTVALAGGGFIDEAKRAPNTEVVVISRENRDLLAVELAHRLERELHPGKRT